MSSNPHEFARHLVRDNLAQHAGKISHPVRNQVALSNAADCRCLQRVGWYCQYLAEFVGQIEWFQTLTRDAFLIVLIESHGRMPNQFKMIFLVAWPPTCKLQKLAPVNILWEKESASVTVFSWIEKFKETVSPNVQRWKTSTGKPCHNRVFGAMLRAWRIWLLIIKGRTWTSSKMTV